jgi:hypothetical protein
MPIWVIRLNVCAILSLAKTITAPKGTGQCQTVEFSVVTVGEGIQNNSIKNETLLHR